MNKLISCSSEELKELHKEYSILKIYKIKKDDLWYCTTFLSCIVLKYKGAIVYVGQ